MYGPLQVTTIMVIVMVIWSLQNSMLQLLILSPIFLFCFSRHDFLCNFGLGNSFVDQAGLELTEICLPLPPECLD